MTVSTDTGSPPVRTKALPPAHGPYRRLASSARLVLDERFLSGQGNPDLSEHEYDADLDHGFDAELLERLLAQAMTRVSSEKASSTDAWLAPRLHAVLRLRRSEAADKAIWFWLATSHAREYIRWRWPATVNGKSLKRYHGGDRDHALARLWWTAEMFRNGEDYSPAVNAFSLQDITSTWMSLNACHNPAAAQAATLKIQDWSEEEESRLSKRANALARVFNHRLTTVMLDVVAPLPGPDAGAADEWVQGEPDSSVLDDALPAGPPEDEVEDAAIDAVLTLLHQVASEEGIDID